MDNKILIWQEKADFSGFLVSETENYDLINWTGKKISFAEIQKVMSFFVWQFKIYKTESQLRILRDSKGNFIFVPFFQYIEQGLQSNEIKDSKENIELTEKYLKEGFHFFGSIHHHCQASAFQSSTDYNDEIKINGFHFTIGNLDNDIFSLHGRFVFRSICYKINLLEIFENLDFLNTENIPENIFPFNWMETLKEKPVIEKPIFENFRYSEKTETEHDNSFFYSDVYNHSFFNNYENDIEKIENEFLFTNIDTDYLFYLKNSTTEIKNRILEFIDFLEYINSNNSNQENFDFIEFLENIENLNNEELQKIKKLIERK